MLDSIVSPAFRKMPVRKDAMFGGDVGKGGGAEEEGVFEEEMFSETGSPDGRDEDAVAASPISMN